MNYSLSYIILVASSLVIASAQIGINFDEKSQKFLNRFVWLSFLCFFGLRGFIGWDWYNYYPLFERIKPITQTGLEIKSAFDIGFVIYVSIVKTLSKDYHFFIFISSLIDFILLHYFLNKYIPKYLYVFAFVVFITMEGVIMEINLMRNIKALLLFLLSLQYIEKRNFFKFVLLNLLGLTFHWSSVIFFPLYFFLNKKIDLRIFIAVFIVGNIVYLTKLHYIKPFVTYVAHFIGETATEKTDAYLNSSLFNTQYEISIGYIERIFTAGLIMLNYNQLIEKSKSNILFINSFILFFIFYFYFSEVNIIVSRIGNLFIFSYWILWPSLIDTYNHATKYILFAIFGLYMSLKIQKATNNILFRYDNVLYEHSQPYNERVKIFEKNARKIQRQK